MSSTRKFKLKGCNGELFEVDEAVANEFQMTKFLIDENCADDVIPLLNVSSEILAKVIDYCKKHVEASTYEGYNADDDLKSWDAEFVTVDQAANCLNIKGLLGLTCQTTANMMKGMTPEEIRMTFNIRNDFTTEEEKEVCRENQWAFE